MTRYIHKTIRRSKYSYIDYRLNIYVTQQAYGRNHPNTYIKWILQDLTPNFISGKDVTEYIDCICYIEGFEVESVCIRDFQNHLVIELG